MGSVYRQSRVVRSTERGRDSPLSSPCLESKESVRVHRAAADASRYATCHLTSNRCRKTPHSGHISSILSLKNFLRSRIMVHIPPLRRGRTSQSNHSSSTFLHFCTAQLHLLG